MIRLARWGWLCALALLFGATSRAETGAEAWLRYAPLETQTARKYAALPNRTVLLGDSMVLKTAQQELVRGVSRMLRRPLPIADRHYTHAAILLGTVGPVYALVPQMHPPHALLTDTYWITSASIHGSRCLIITAANDRGVLYGVFALLGMMARGENIDALDPSRKPDVSQPSAPIRWINQWDNLDGRIERGYGGPSIFFENGKVRDDLTGAGEYARLLASIGINACAINNVNADPRILDSAFILQLKRIADAFRPWGVRLALSVDLGSPKSVGGLDTFDPLDPRVAEFWKKKADELYAQIPDFAGFVVKADSEGRLGPSTYNRTHAEAANVVARALKPHGGVIFYRAFVYNHHLDWHDLKNDRAKAAYDNFHPLDGAFDDNVVIQIKNGPIDFQVREPVSPLFAGLRRTNQAIELQITQEYTGQQKHLCFLAPMWKEALDFDMRAAGNPSLVKDIVAGRRFHRDLGGFVGVANAGMDANWMGSTLAMANLYAFGRLAWNPNLGAREIAEDWTRMTFSNDPSVVHTIASLQMDSWPVYERYTGPLGVGTLTNITGNHYDPAPQSSEENGWGQWHRGDQNGIGMDRTVASGTGYIGQYPPEVQKVYESVDDCPDELLLFFHHVPYTRVLHSGPTVAQYFYDSHYDGAAQAHGFIARWETLRGHIDGERYEDVLARLKYQEEQAVVWRDAICGWMYKLSGIADQKGRFGPTHAN